MPDITYLAGGLVVWREHELLLASGGLLSVFDLDTGVLRDGVFLGDMGIWSIDGLAHDRERGELLILDGVNQQLFVVPDSIVE